MGCKTWRLALTPGTRLGVYDVLVAIGEGGMGQVFRARDTKLNREVALKVLPDSFANDPERLARFTREAQTLASLNHPHIAVSSDGQRFFVNTVVDQPTRPALTVILNWTPNGPR